MKRCRDEVSFCFVSFRLYSPFPSAPHSLLVLRRSLSLLLSLFVFVGGWFYSCDRCVRLPVSSIGDTAYLQHEGDSRKVH
jgi:hypothetical protein